VGHLLLYILSSLPEWKSVECFHMSDIFHDIRIAADPDQFQHQREAKEAFSEVSCLGLPQGGPRQCQGFRGYNGSR